MKQLFLLALVLTLGLTAFSQSENVYWLDHTLNTVKQRKSTYKMVVSPKGSTYSVTTYDSNDQVFMEAQSMDAEGQVLHGNVTYYYPTGSMESQGQYLKGKKVGLWKRYTPRGVEKAERIYNLYDAKIGAYTYVDKMPTFDQGIESFDEFLKLSFSHYVNPSEGKGQEIKISFIINEAGYLLEPKISQNCSPKAKEELMEILGRMPAWTPGEKQGEKVNVFVEKNIYCQ